jgi:large subunit ribosomal protein L9
MELILREDIEKLGQRGEVVNVAPGYARNFLLPKRLAVVANASNKKIVDQEREAHLRREAKLQKAGEEGHLFGSVNPKDIAEALEKQNYTIDRRKIQLADPIKQVGEYKIPVKLHMDVTAEITVIVAAE